MGNNKNAHWILIRNKVIQNTVKDIFKVLKEKEKNPHILQFYMQQKYYSKYGSTIKSFSHKKIWENSSPKDLNTRNIKKKKFFKLKDDTKRTLRSTLETEECQK